MDPDDKIREICNALDGTLLAPTDYPAGSLEWDLLERRKLIDDRIKIAHSLKTDKPMPPIHLGYCHSPVLNGCADVSDDQAHVVISTGAIVLMHDVFYRMLSHPVSFPNIGDPNLESAGIGHAEGISRDYQELVSGREENKRTLASVVPRCPYRRLHAEWLAGLALDFLTLHEMGHLRHGHSGFIGGLTGSLPLHELLGSVHSVPNLVRQAIEMDADSYAAASMLATRGEAVNSDFVLHRFLQESGSGLFFSENMYPPGWFAMFAVDWAFAINIMFWMMGIDIVEAVLESTHYPPPPFRGIMSTSIVFADSVSGKHEHQGLIARFEEKTTNLFAKLIDNLKLIGFDVKGNEFINFAKACEKGVVWDHQKKISDTWTQIRPEIVKHSFVKNLAP